MRILYGLGVAVLCLLLSCGERRAADSSPKKSSHAVLKPLTSAPLDSFHDGTPDFLRLSGSDADSFRRWFATIAEIEAVVPDDRRSPEITDCAALLRFSYREALRRHDSVWMRAMPLEGIAVPAEISKYNFPRTPLGANIFRVRPAKGDFGSFVPGDFAEFADAKTLATLNSFFISRDVRAARPGDLLFFYQPDQHSPYHSMIFVGRSQFDAGTDWLVYHTGRDAKSKGEMRRLTVGDLRHHPDSRWHPVATNPNFLGVFRWNILREAN